MIIIIIADKCQLDSKIVFFCQRLFIINDDDDDKVDNRKIRNTSGINYCGSVYYEGFFFFGQMKFTVIYKKKFEWFWFDKDFLNSFQTKRSYRCQHNVIDKFTKKKFFFR